MRERLYLLKSIWSSATSTSSLRFEDERDAVGLSLKKYLPCISFLYDWNHYLSVDWMDKWKPAIEEACLHQNLPLDWPLDEAFVSFLPSRWLSDRSWILSYVTKVYDKGLSLSYLVRDRHLLGRTQVLTFLKQCPAHNFCDGRAKLPVEWHGDKQLAVDSLQAGVGIIEAFSLSLQDDPDVLMAGAGTGPDFFKTAVGRKHRSNLTLACHAAKQPQNQLFFTDILKVVDPILVNSRQLQACSSQIVSINCI